MTMPQHDEASEWAAAARGDADALGAVFDRHSSRVYRHALSMLRHPQDAEDATAVAFLELWRRRVHVRVVNGSVLPWLLATVSFASRNVARSARRYRSVIDALPRGDYAESAEASASRDLHDLDQHIDPALADAIRELPKATAALLALTAFEGLTTADAAAAVGVSPAAARKRLSRARSSLRAVLAQPLTPELFPQEVPHE